MTSFDDVIAKYGGAEWTYSVLPLPMPGRRTAEMIEEEWTITYFLTNCCRDVAGVKSAWMLLDVQRNLPEFSVTEQIKKCLTEGKPLGLPENIRPKEELPPKTKTGLLLVNNEDGTVDVIKTYLPEAPVNVATMSRCVRGLGYVPQFRTGPWKVKKGFCAALASIVGFHILWTNVAQRSVPTLKSGGSKDWNPPDDELLRGVDFINSSDCPDDDGANEQTVWILQRIREGSGFPIEGWPEQRVRKMAENKSKGPGAKKEGT